MGYFKFAGWAVSALAFLLVASLLVGAAMTIVDFYDGLDEENGEDTPIHEPSERPEEDETPEDDSESADDSGNYVNNLSLAFGTGYVEGLFEDVSIVDGETLASLYEKLTANIAGSAEGAVLASSSSYASGTHIIVKTDVKLSGPYAVGKETVSVKYKVDSSTDPSIKDATVKIVSRDEEVDIKTVELYMGYIIINSEEGASLCDENGRVLLSDMGDKEPANRRTVSGSPVFKDASGAYYIFDSEKSEFSAAESSALLIGLEYDSPYRPYVDENGNQIYAKYDSKSKKYVFYSTEKDEQTIKTAYADVYSFSESGYALVKNGSLYIIIDAGGKEVFGVQTSNYYYYPDKTVNQGYWVRAYYELPYINDIRAIGSGTVDEYGYLRMRIRLVGRSNSVYGQVVADEERLVNVNTGKYFTIPDGYTLEGYSDGVLLLSRDGRYGYYSIEGHWIAQPIYTYAQPFVQGLAVVGHENGTRGMIDTEGNIVLPFAFTYVSNVSSGLVSAYSESGGWEIFKVLELPTKEPAGDVTEGVTEEDLPSEVN